MSLWAPFSWNLLSFSPPQQVDCKEFGGIDLEFSKVKEGLDIRKVTAILSLSLHNSSTHFFLPPGPL